MNRRHEYAVRWRREGSHDQVRIHQTGFYARRWMRRVMDAPGAPLEYIRLERRSVGPWETIDVAVDR